MSENANNASGGNTGGGNNASPRQSQFQSFVVYTNNGDANGGLPVLNNPLGQFFNVERFHKKKQHTQADIMKTLKPVTKDDVESFPTDCPICLLPFDTTENITEEDKQRQAAEKKQLEEEDESVGASEDIPLVPFADPNGDGFITYHGLRKSEDKFLEDDDEDEDEHSPQQIKTCKHIFGKSCIAKWLETNSTCPMCRRDIMEDTEEDNGDSMTYPIALTEFFVPVTWIYFTPELQEQDPAVSFPEASTNGVFVQGPRVGPPVEEIRQRYESRQQNQDSADSNTDIATPQPNGSNEQDSESQQTGGPVRSNSRNSNSRSHPYTRLY